MKKCLAVGIILLFIGVAIAPSINFIVVKASDDNDLVEVTTQACGIKGYGNTTVKLTREQYQNLEQYLVEFRARLNQTTTREEAIPIFKEAVVELNKYGLLPKGMSVERAQRLILAMNPDIKHRKLFDRILIANQELDSNLFCLITGSSTNSLCFTGTYSLLTFLGSLEKINIFSFLAVYDLFLNWLRMAFFPFYLFGEISFSWMESDGYGHSFYHYSNGSITSIDILGVQTWSDTLYGEIGKIWEPSFAPGVPPKYYYTGIAGFTGFSIITYENTNFIIGSCVYSRIYDT
jgi:hypothetical protein